MSAAEVIDARGLLCPLPVLRLRKALLAVEPGAHVVLIASDPMAVVDVPHFCGAAGHVMLAMRDLHDGTCEFTVERGLSAPSAASGLTPEDI
ncbi:sulfurtransferase TusA family protein [Paracoccus marinaquae]|uniref:sulfurtransferase TusA family protein n=1 Tax=Paracoccus marinaquae TaxID=2841926 RepID=UPI0032AF5D7B